MRRGVVRVVLIVGGWALAVLGVVWLAAEVVRGVRSWRVLEKDRSKMADMHDDEREEEEGSWW